MLPYAFLNRTVSADPADILSTIIAGLVLAGIGWVLYGRKGFQVPHVSSLDIQATLDDAQAKHLHQLKSRASMAVIIGTLLLIVGRELVLSGQSFLSLLLVGWAMIILGSVGFARWKGYSGWVGFLGYLLLPGLIILGCLPDRKKRFFPVQSGQLDAGASPTPVPELDKGPGFRFLWTLLPLAILYLIYIGAGFQPVRATDAAEWEQVSQPALGFRALMPGTPRLEQEVHNTSDGPAEDYRFIVSPKDKRQVFMITSVRYLESGTPQQDRTAKRLAFARDDLVSGARGVLKSERSIALSDRPGLELKVWAEKGRLLRARIFATESQTWYLLVLTSKRRLPSPDTDKFFNSFAFLADPEPGAAPAN